MNENIKKFRRRVFRSAILKSVLASLIIAGGVLTVAALASWIFDFKAGLWLSIGLFFGTLIVGSVLFYFLKYRPTAKDVARSIDATGLEERLITMMELEGDDSYIAKMQREDTKKALAAADHTLIKVAASVALCAAVGVSALFGAGALVVDSLYVADVIPGGIHVASYEEEIDTYRVNYTASITGGKIYFWEENAIGDEVQDAIEVNAGEDAPAVIVVPEDGYVFVGWSDGENEPYRQDQAVSRNITVRALFAAVAQLPDLQDDGDFKPFDDNGRPSPGDGEETPPMPSKQKPEDATASGAANDSNKQIVDGNHYYGDDYNQAYEDAMDRLGGNNEIPGDLQGGIEGYLGAIGKEGEGSTTP